MFSRKVKNRFGSGIVRKCRGCQNKFGFFTNRTGLGGEFLTQEFDLAFSVHEVTCMTTSLWKKVEIDPKVGSYIKNGVV